MLPLAFLEVRRSPRRAAFKTSFGRFKNAIISQETGGRYGLQNYEGSGASGIGQVMPDTAKALAARIGLPFRLDLLRGTSPAARQYQDRITEAALQEAWQAGNGDPAAAARYYFAGPDKSKHGPKTARYVNDILGRLR